MLIWLIIHSYQGYLPNHASLSGSTSVAWSSIRANWTAVAAHHRLWMNTADFLWWYALSAIISFYMQLTVSLNRLEVLVGLESFSTLMKKSYLARSCYYQHCSCHQNSNIHICLELCLVHMVLYCAPQFYHHSSGETVACCTMLPFWFSHGLPLWLSRQLTLWLLHPMISRSPSKVLCDLVRQRSFEWQFHMRGLNGSACI